MVKSSVTEWYLVAELFSMVADHSISDHLDTEQVKDRYSDKFIIQMFALQISTVSYHLFCLPKYCKNA